MSECDSALAELQKARELLEKVVVEGQTSAWPSRAAIDEIVTLLRSAEIRLLGPKPRSAKGEGAINLLREYLIEHVGEEIPGEVLREVSGIQEWARRLRELRVQQGYQITELGESRYRLESATPNTEEARRWRMLHSIRQQGGSAIGRIEELFIQNVGEVIARDEVDYVARIKEGSRRVRELRDEHGWPINSRVDEPGLGNDEYRLVSSAPEDRRDPAQRKYEEDLRHRIFQRDDFTCMNCGRNRASADAAGDTRFYLEVHHKTAVASDLSDLAPQELNDPRNLVTLCHACHKVETSKLHSEKRLRRSKS